MADLDKLLDEANMLYLALPRVRREELRDRLEMDPSLPLRFANKYIKGDNQLFLLATGDGKVPVSNVSLTYILTRIMNYEKYELSKKISIVQSYINNLKAMRINPITVKDPIYKAAAAADAAAAAADAANAAEFAAIPLYIQFMIDNVDWGALRGKQVPGDPSLNGKLLLKVVFEERPMPDTDPITDEKFNTGDELVVLERGKLAMEGKGNEFSHVFKRRSIIDWFEAEYNRGRPPTNPNTRNVLKKEDIETFILIIKDKDGKMVPPLNGRYDGGGTSYKRYKYTISRKKLQKRRKTQRRKNTHMRLKRK